MEECLSAARLVGLQLRREIRGDFRIGRKEFRKK